MQYMRESFLLNSQNVFGFRGLRLLHPTTSHTTAWTPGSARPPSL